MPFAADQLAVFQGASDEHPAPVSHPYLTDLPPRAGSAKLVRDVRSEQRGKTAN
jgi:hypothetical protein